MVLTVVRLRGSNVVDNDFCGGRRGHFILESKNIQTALQGAFSRTAQKADRLQSITTNIKMALVSII